MNQLERFELASATASPWFYMPGSTLYVLGFDTQGHPFVSAGFADRYEVWLVTSSTTATKVWSGAGTQVPSRVAASDSHGAWFDARFALSTSSMVWLYAGGSIQPAAQVAVGGLAVAGSCIS